MTSSHHKNGTINGDQQGEMGTAAMEGIGPMGMDRMDSIAVKKTGAGNARRKSKKLVEEPDELAKLPKIKEQAKLEERTKLAVCKMQLCQRIFNFHDPDVQLSGKEAKRLALEELVDFLRNIKGAVTEKFYSEIFAMVSLNIFRDLPPREDEWLGQAEFELAQQSGPETEIDFGNWPDPSWAHLEQIYEIFLHFLNSLEFRATLAKKFVDQQFLQRLFGLFQSEDQRERQLLSKIVKKIYAKFIRLRIFIRKQACNNLLAFLYESGQQRFCGVAEMLDILQCSVDDFRVPLKADSKELFQKVLLPLHKSQLNGYHLFHGKLTDRVVQFVELDPSLAKPVVDTLLKYWPNTSCTREVHFLEEVERLLKVTDLDQFRAIAIPLFAQIAKCIGSSHSQRFPTVPCGCGRRRAAFRHS